MADESPFLQRPPIATERALALLHQGTAKFVGRMPYSSNATFLVDIDHEGLLAQAIYKPLAGERTLWDFPDGLYQREIAAFVVSEALGWCDVPPTIVRHDLPHGVGSLQLFMPGAFNEHYFSLHKASTTHDEAFRRICAFDIIINNTDRKSGHCLLGADDRIWAIDHGVAFHHEFKLRTVIWDFVDEPISAELCRDIEGLVASPPQALHDLLNVFERDAMLTRAGALRTTGKFPDDDTGGRRWPWPLV